MKSDKKPKEVKKPNVNDELEGLDITINSLGEIHSTYDIDKINKFLNKHVKDKKLTTEEEDKKTRTYQSDADETDSES